MNELKKQYLEELKILTDLRDTLEGYKFQYFTLMGEYPVSKDDEIEKYTQLINEILDMLLLMKVS